MLISPESYVFDRLNFNELTEDEKLEQLNKIEKKIDYYKTSCSSVYNGEIYMVDPDPDVMVEHLEECKKIMEKELFGK